VEYIYIHVQYEEAGRCTIHPQSHTGENLENGIYYMYDTVKHQIMLLHTSLSVWIMLQSKEKR